MAITPQAIKDQEFQSKFRGYDTIEVKGYLELVAEEFFELLEKVRLQEDDRDELVREKALLQEMNQKLEADIETALATTEDVRRESVEKDEKLAGFAKELDELQVGQADFEVERQEFEEEVSAAEGRVSEIEDQLRQSQSESDGLRNKIEMLKEQNNELKNGEVDFKRTIGAAQQFADSLKQSARQEAEKLQQESESKASTLLQSAKDEVEQLRQDAFAELSRLPEEIEQLNRQRNQAREELREILTGYLEKVDSFSGADDNVKRYEYDDLFQKIEIPDAPIAFDQELAALEEELEEERDELDDIDMELPLPDDMGFEKDDEADDQEDLRNKLEEGGIAYLSEN